MCALQFTITFPLPTGSDFVFDLDPLWDSIIPAKSISNILSTKIELKLAKVTAAKRWADLEGESEVVEKVQALVKEDKPVYPSSSKTGPKDWDKLARDLSDNAKKAKDKAKDKGKGKGKAGADNDDEDDAENDDLAYDSDEEGDPVNSFFKKLYKDADEDTRRAMMKSYIESNGTALSTNWGEVGKGKVETSPPGEICPFPESN